jgi:exopolysaccharide biosynthesis predicted pyruvyltransferase EpsI
MQAANAFMVPLYRAASRDVMRYGAKMLDRGKVLVTDRLHPHILALLRGQPSVLLPDRYGKNRAVYDYSSHGYSTVHWADTPEQAMQMARSLAAQS